MHTHTYRYPPDRSGQTQHIYLWIVKTGDILLVRQEQEQLKQYKHTHTQTQATSVAASRGQACDSCGSEGDNTEDI